MTKAAIRHHANFISAYLDYSACSEAPAVMHQWTAVSTIAGALRGKVYIDQGFFIWPSNFYIIFIAPPGVVSKTTTANIGMELLRQVPGIKMGPDIVTWEALAQAFVAAAEEYEIDGEPLITSSLTIASSEFGNFLDPKNKEMVNFLVHLWDGQNRTTRKLTKTMGEDNIRNPWINIIACATPAWVADNFDSYFIGGGFVSRCIFIYAEEKRHLTAYPSAILPKGFKAMEVKLVEDLEIISQIKGPFTLTEDALAWGDIWYKEHYKKHTLDPNADKRMQSYYARKQTHLHKLAIILSAAEDSSRKITIEHLSSANKMLNAIEGNMLQVYNQVGNQEETKAANEIIELAKRSGKLKLNEVYNRFSRMLTATQFEEALKSAQKTGKLEIIQQGSSYFIRYLGA